MGYNLLDSLTGETLTVESETERDDLLLVEVNGDSWNAPIGADIMGVRAGLESEGHVMRYSVIE